jgi:membrane protease YdiL (CAAX protease family)
MQPVTRSLLTFFGLTYLVSWSCFLGGTSGPLFFIGVFAPSLVAVALTAHRDGRTGVSALVQGISKLPAGAGWYVFALGYMAAIKLMTAVVHRVLIGVWPPFGTTPVYIMAGAIVISTLVQAGEELGWRAYALPRLANRLGLASASVVLGAIWAVWHLPLFLIPGTETFAQPFPVYLAGVTALSVAMAWLYWRTNGSLMLTMMMHAAVNNTKDIVPSATMNPAGPFVVSASTVAWLTAALLWVCAACFLASMRGATWPVHPGAGPHVREAATV